jgi:hypothetical protein
MYKVVGNDRREYGPVSRESILEWIAQGRANAQTIARFEDGAWKPLATFDEFKPALGLAAAPPAATTSTAPGQPPQTPLIQTTYVNSGSEPPPFSGVASQRSTNTCSVLGIIFPIVCSCCCFIGPILGIIFSLIGLSQIRAHPNKYSTTDALPKIGLGISIAILLLHVVMQLLDSKLATTLPKVFPKGGFNF